MEKLRSWMKPGGAGKAGYKRLTPRDDGPPAPTAPTPHHKGRLPTREEVTPQKLAQYLGVSLANTTERDSCGSETKSGHLAENEIIVQTFVDQHFPEPPADAQQNLQHHLLNIQETVMGELLRAATMNDVGLMGLLIGCYHRKTFGHLDTLLKGRPSARDTFVLLNWVLHTYLSPNLLGHPELQGIAILQYIDMLMFTEWVSKATDGVLQQVKREMDDALGRALQCERDNRDSQRDEACVGLYVDIIQLTDSFIKEAKKIASKLSANVQEVCFQELLTFLLRFATEQEHFLQKKAKMDLPEVHNFLKALKICRELKQYVSTRASSVTSSLAGKVLATLENMEASTLNCLKQCVSRLAKSHLKTYFNGDKKQIVTLRHRMEMMFPRTWLCEETHMTVMNEVYKLLVHKYLEHLVKVSQPKLTRIFGDVAQTLREDAMWLQEITQNQAPGAEEWNLLLKVEELLHCIDNEMVIYKTEVLLKQHDTLRKDQDLLLALLRWLGLRRGSISKVLDACTEHRDRPRYISCFSCPLYCLLGDRRSSVRNIWDTC